MKICGTIAEYNPLHLGHLKHLDYMKNTLKADKIIVVMSGDFTQRGEPAVMDKYTRAKAAVISGADMVIELPTAFATQNAEIFAKGGIGILNSLGIVNDFCFGAETGTKEDFIRLADILNNESKEFKKLLKLNLETGHSFAKSKYLTVKELYGDISEDLMSLPNNILGIEYARALNSLSSSIELCPMMREGDHNDKQLKKKITSACSLREKLKQGKLRATKKFLPPYVFRCLKEYPFAFEKIILSSVLTTPAEEIAKITDCSEGLENRIKALSKDNISLEALIDKVSTKRYTQARISRILISNLLKIEKSLVSDGLQKGLYAKVLAVSSDSKELVSMISEKSTIPVLTRKSDENKLNSLATAIFKKDVLANDLYNLATGEKQNPSQMLIV